MANLLLPDIAGTALQGYDRGRNMAANKLLGLAIANPDQSAGYLGQAAQINPGAVLALQGQQARNQYMQSQGQAMQAKASQEQQSEALKKIGGAARYMAAALQTNDPAKIEGAYQAVRPYLAELGQAQGKTPPPQWDPNMAQAIYHVIAQTAAAFPDDLKIQNVTPGTVQTRGGIPVFSNPSAAKIVNGMAVAPGQNGNLVASPIPIAGAGAAPQAQAPQAGESTDAVMGQIAAQATQLVNSGQMTPQQADQWVAQQARAAGVQFTPDSGAPAAQAPQGQPQTLAQAIAAGKGRGQSAPSGYQWNADHTGLEPIPGGPADKGVGFQGDSNAALFGDPALSGEQYVESIPQGNREIVKGLLNGTVALPTGTTLKNPLWQSALASVKHADPSWNQAAYKQFANTRKFMTTGKGGQLVNSINTAAQHLQKLVADVNALDNGRFSDINAVSNFFGRHTGGQAITDFSGDLTPVASELAAVYKNGGTPTDQETQHWREALSPDMSKAQQLNVIRGWIDLLAGKLNATRSQYQASMSPLSEPLSVINPKAAQALERITDLANQVSTTGQHEMPQEDTSPIYAPGQQAPQAQPTDVSSLLSKYGIQ